MDIIYFLIPISLILVAVIIYFLLWAVRSGQFDDLDASGYQILMDDDDSDCSTENTKQRVDSDSEQQDTGDSK